MRELIAGISAAFVSLFGFGTPVPAPSSHLNQQTSEIVAQAASVQTAAVVTATHGVLYVPQGIAAAYTADSASPPDHATSTVQYITQPVIERTVQTVVADASGVDEKISALRNELIARMNAWTPAVSFSGAPAFTPVSVAAFAPSQKIDQLANVTITNATVDGVTGLTDDDIPNDVTASNYLPISGGTLTGALTGAVSLSGSLYLATTSGASTGVIYAGNTHFIHNYQKAGSNGFNTFMGVGAGNLTAGSSNAWEGSSNSGFGYGVLQNVTTGYNNSAFGVDALKQSTTGSRNVAFGLGVLEKNVTGSGNTALGMNALQYNTQASSMVAIGDSAGVGNWTNYSNTGSTIVGYFAGFAFQTGSDYNTTLGYRSGYNITTGKNNLILATATSSTSIANLTTGSQNILIGNNISLPSATASGQLNIGNILYGTGITGTGTTLSSGSIGVGTTTPWRKLSVTGTVGFDGLTGSTGAGSLCLTAAREVVYNSGSDACLPSLRDTKHDITSLSLNALQIVDALGPVSFVYNDSDGRVRYGFIAEDTAAVDSHLVTYSASGTLSGIDDRSIISIVVKAIQELRSRVDSYFTRTEQLEARVAALEAQLTASSAGDSAALAGESDDSAPDTEPPTITINGNNPATLQVGDTYSDLGATVTDNVDTNLSYQVFIGSTPLDQAHIDTSEPNEWHIYYVATDNAGNTATSTRSVIVETASIVPTAGPEPELLTS